MNFAASRSYLAQRWRILSQDDVVDEAGCADTASDREQSASSDAVLDRRKRVGVAHFDVIDRRGRTRNRLARDPFERTRLALSALEGARGSIQTACNAQGPRPLLGRKVGISRAHREPVRLAHRRVPDDFDGQQEVARHSAHHEKLLVVLAPENRNARTDDGEEFGHHRGHTLEVPRAMLAFERFGQLANAHARLLAQGVHRGGLGRENGVYPRRRELLQIALHVARITREVFARTELRRVDEHRCNEESGSAFRFVEEREVAHVKRAHRRNEAHALAVAPNDVAGCEHLGRIGDDARSHRSPEQKLSRIEKRVGKFRAPMGRFHRSPASVVVLVGTLATTASHATEPDPVKRARELFLQAETDEDSGRWSEALDKLRAVSQVKLTAGVRYHIALCEEHLGELSHALGDYRVAADQARVDGAKDVLRSVGRELAALDARVPRLIIHVTPRPQDTSARLDGEPAPDLLAGAAVPVNPGVHYLEVRAPDRPVYTQAVVLQEREFRVLEIRLAEPAPTPPPTENTPPAPTSTSAPPASPASPPVSPPEPLHPSSPQHAPRTDALVAAGISLTLAGGGVAAFLVADNRRDYAVSACAAKVTNVPDACDSLKTPVRIWDFVAAGAWAAALAAGTVAVILWTKPHRSAGDTSAPGPRSERASLGVLVGPAALGVGGQF